METIEINGIKYVKLEEVEKEYIEKNKIPQANTPSFTIISKNSMVLDETNCIALGVVQLGEGYVSCRISTAFLEKALNVMKLLSFNKRGLEAVDLCWAKNCPAILGKRADSGEISGVIIAPRVED